MPVKALVT